MYSNNDNLPAGPHSVWIATGFLVDAATPHEAEEQAQRWLADLLSVNPPMSEEGMRMIRSAASLADAAALALQLLAVEERGGAAAERIARLRAEVDEDMGPSPQVGVLPQSF